MSNSSSEETEIELVLTGSKDNLNAMESNSKPKYFDDEDDDYDGDDGKDEKDPLPKKGEDTKKKVENTNKGKDKDKPSSKSGTTKKKDSKKKDTSEERMIDDEEAEEIEMRAKKASKKSNDKKKGKEKKSDPKEEEEEEEEDFEDEGDDEYEYFVNESISKEEDKDTKLTKEQIKEISDTNILARRSKLLKKLSNYDDGSFFGKDESNKIDFSTYGLIEKFKEFRKEPIVQLTKGLIEVLPEAEEEFRMSHLWTPRRINSNFLRTIIPNENFLMNRAYPDIVSYSVPDTIYFTQADKHLQYYYYEATVVELT